MVGFVLFCFVFCVCVCVICLFVVVVPAAAIYLLITNVLNASQWEEGSSKTLCYKRYTDAQSVSDRS